MGNACQTCNEELGTYVHDPYQRYFNNKAGQYIAQKNNITLQHQITNTDIPNASLAKPVTLPQLNPRINEIVNTQNSIKPFLKEMINGTKLRPYQLLNKGLVYDGQWISGTPHGFGKAFYQNGGYFQGYFKNGIADCEDGLFIYPDGTFYRGNIKNSSANGIGTLVYRNKQMVYNGEWLNDKPHGQGKQLFKDGSCYLGSFVNGVKQGKGSFKWADGSEYTGMFDNGLMNGEGVQKLANGEIYKGTFQRNKRSGKGVLSSPLGVYQGMFKDDKKQGQGQFKFPDGRVFIGSFVQNLPDGNGKMSIPNGQVLNGLWKNGQNIKVQSSKSSLNISKISVNRSYQNRPPLFPL